MKSFKDFNEAKNDTKFKPTEFEKALKAIKSGKFKDITTKMFFPPSGGTLTISSGEKVLIQGTLEDFTPVALKLLKIG